MIMFFVNLIAFVLIARSFAFGEPKCSKFDYEEKLLSKMIRMEIEMEQIKRNIETNIKPSIENLTLTVAPKVAFSAYTPAAKTTYGNGDTVVFTTVLFNEMSSYDSSTGVFTAQEKGLYHFIVHICNALKSFAVVAIVHNEKKTAISTQYEDNHSACGSVSALIQVEIGDKVYVISGYESTSMLEDVYRRASFMGYLVHV